MRTHSKDIPERDIRECDSKETREYNGPSILLLSPLSGCNVLINARATVRSNNGDRRYHSMDLLA